MKEIYVRALSKYEDLTSLEKKFVSRMRGRDKCTPAEILALHELLRKYEIKWEVS